MGLRPVVFALLVAGCATARFQQFDGSFDPKPAAKAPAVFDGPVLPPQYRMVGVIEVFETTDPKVIVEQVVSRGREIGCDLVMREVRPEADDDEAAARPPPATDHVNYVCAVEQPH